MYFKLNMNVFKMVLICCLGILAVPAYEWIPIQYNKTQNKHSFIDLANKHSFIDLANSAEIVLSSDSLDRLIVEHDNIKESHQFPLKYSLIQRLTFGKCELTKQIFICRICSVYDEDDDYFTSGIEVIDYKNIQELKWPITMKITSNVWTHTEGLYHLRLPDNISFNDKIYAAFDAIFCWADVDRIHESCRLGNTHYICCLELDASGLSNINEQLMQCIRYFQNLTLELGIAYVGSGHTILDLVIDDKLRLSLAPKFYNLFMAAKQIPNLGAWLNTCRSINYGTRNQGYAEPLISLLQHNIELKCATAVMAKTYIHRKIIAILSTKSHSQQTFYNTNSQSCVILKQGQRAQQLLMHRNHVLN